MSANRDNGHKKPAVRHHYVPKALLRPWLVGEQQKELIAFWWNPHRKQLDCKRSGLNSFGYEKHLLSLGSGQVAPDALEKVFFGNVDDRGCKVRDKIVGQNRLSLNGDERTDFARLLLSLESRRPENVVKLRASAETMRRDLDSDPKIIAALAAHGFDMKPSEFTENVLNHSIDDGALLIIQRLVDNPNPVGSKLINMRWQIRHLGDRDGKLILSDRPLVRIGGIEDPSATWAIPLTPTCAFIATASVEVANRVRRSTGQRFCKLLNVSSAGQADRFAFTVNEADAHWLGRYLKRPLSKVSDS